MKTALVYKGFDIKRGFALFGLFRHRNFALTHKVINRGLRQKGWLVLFAEGNSVTCSRDACHCISGIVREEARFENFDAVNHLRIECIHKLLCACQGMHLDIHIFAIALKPYAKRRGKRHDLVRAKTCRIGNINSGAADCFLEIPHYIKMSYKFEHTMF